MRSAPACRRSPGRRAAAAALRWHLAWRRLTWSDPASCCPPPGKPVEVPVDRLEYPCRIGRIVDGLPETGGIRQALAVPADVLAGIANAGLRAGMRQHRSDEHTSELQSLMRISYAVLCLKKK